jgi:hypothetical protein
VTDAAIHRMQWARKDNAVRFLDHSGSPRAFSPRDDKSEGEWGMIWAVGLQHTVCHCEEGAEARDAAIHRVSRELGRLLSSLPCSQWIATGFQPSR